jgi:arylsulfatase A-like enzyme
MKLRTAARTAVIIVLASVLFLINTSPFTRRRAKDINVILLTVDSLRPDHLGCYGYRKMTSPNIDTIAATGQIFRRAYSQSVWTIPGLMSVLTSLQPPVHQVDRRGSTLNLAVTTIFDSFREAGYATPNLCFVLTFPEFSTIRVGPIEERYFAGQEGEEVFRWLDENAGSKFFLWYHYRHVHLPYRPRHPSRSTFLSQDQDEERLSPGVKAVLSDAAVVPLGTVTFEAADRPIIEDLYDGEVREFDAFVGRLYARLRKHDLIRKTLIVITADHGEELMDHGFVGHASTTHAATLYDEVIRIPLIMSLPGVLPGGVEIKEQVQQTDIMPTLLDIVGIDVPPGVQGRSLAPVSLDLAKENESSLPVFAETVYGGFQATLEMAETRIRCVRTDAWKLIETDSPSGKSYQLFDLLLDPNELHNVYADMPETAAQLKAWLDEWNSENTMRRQMIEAGASIRTVTGQGELCPEMIFPYDGAVLRFSERNGIIRAAWTGSPSASYVVEYEVGAGIHRLTGSFSTFGNSRNFGPYSREIWSSLCVRNPWRARVSPDTKPRCWSPWVEFTFE